MPGTISTSSLIRYLSVIVHPSCTISQTPCTHPKTFDCQWQPLHRLCNGAAAPRSHAAISYRATALSACSVPA